MKKLIGLILFALASLAPVRGDAGCIIGSDIVCTAAAGVSYTGPGDTFTTSPYAAYSCSEAFTAAYATALGNACDLVDSSAPTVVICTLKFAATGKVDLTAYCPGSVTPAAKCAAATGAVCNISQAYDQTGNGRHVVQATSISQPPLAFSSTPLGTLPAINCGNGATSIFLAMAATTTQAQPLTMSLVMNRATGTAAGGAIGNTSGAIFMGGGAGASLAQVNAGTALTSAVTDNTWFSMSGLFSGASSAININGSDSIGNAGAASFAGGNIRVCRAAATQQSGLIAEAIIWSASSTSTDRGNLHTNAHSAGRYNF
jgi:hypothetical protein